MGSKEATQMVNLFTGDLSYNIPLFDLPGPDGDYPFVLNYSSAVSMTEEATWVGFGWNFNAGAITRQLRGLPDDFNGVTIVQRKDMAPSTTVGATGTLNLEIFGGDTGNGFKLGVSPGLTVYSNNYKGIGVRHDFSIHAGYQFSDNVSAGANLSLSSDSHSGSSITPSLSLALSEFNQGYKHTTTGSLSLPMNSRTGLSDLTLGLHMTTSKNYTPEEIKSEVTGIDKDVTVSSNDWGGSSTIRSFASPSFTPAVTSPMGGNRYAFKFKAGGEIFGIMPNGSISGFINRDYIRADQKERNIDAYGYLYLQGAGSNDLLDFNRERDGTLREEMPNLSIPSLTYDVFNVTGHHVAGTFRAYRSDVGAVHDPEVTSEAWGGSLGIEVGVGNLTHVGGDGSYISSYARSGDVTDGSFDGDFSFRGSDSDNPLYEPYYFRFIHEPVMSSLAVNYDKTLFEENGGDEPVSLRIIPADSTRFYKKKWTFSVPSDTVTEDKYGNELIATQLNFKYERTPRRTLIQSFTNADLHKYKETLREYTVIYKNESGDFVELQREANDQIGAFKVIAPNGVSYIYALPAYNRVHHEILQSVDATPGTSPYVDVSSTYNHSDTEEFLNETVFPEYAYAFLLTAILGADYVDIDDQPGPSEGDLGFYISFEYNRKSVSYKWRAPFNGGNFVRGYANSAGISDDKTSFMYGEKELWYLIKASTRTHTADFKISPRSDGRGAANKIQNSSSPATLGEYVYKLDQIDVYSRNQAKPIKKIKFTYDDSLLQGTPNSQNGGGKLTLKALAFSYENSTRGELSPYRFDYKEDDQTSHNPRYMDLAQDRWGGYKPYTHYGLSGDFPYTDQSASMEAELDKRAGFWRLKNISLPTGGRISIDYEADRYNFVQDKPAQQMTAVTGLKSDGNDTFSGGGGDSHGTKIYFRMNKAVPQSAAAAEVRKYLQGIDQIYFKVRINLKTGATPLFELVGGYAEIEDPNDAANYGAGSPDTAGNVSTGWFKVKKVLGYHPFRLAAWQHLRLNQPELIPAWSAPVDFDASFEDLAYQTVALLEQTLSPTFLKFFIGFNNEANIAGWADAVKLTESHAGVSYPQCFVRLNCPEKGKFGGGSRVKSISISDSWEDIAGDSSQLIGQEFIYSLEDSTSSGVASYEPVIGGEENPFRRAKIYGEELRFASDLNLFFEHPINESYFPGPSVGYEKVTVRSFTASKIRKGQLDRLVPSTGESRYQFYTYKDFPVEPDESDIEIEIDDNTFFMPFFGSILSTSLIADQGYSFVSSDANGKLRSKFDYAYGENGSVTPEPVQSETHSYTNKVNFIVDAGLYEKNGETKFKDTLITDYQIFIQERFRDHRHSYSSTDSHGINVNLDAMIYGFIPGIFAIPWYSFGFTESNATTSVSNNITEYTYVENKSVINRQGTISESRILAYDGFSGNPVLTATKNEFGKEVFVYKTPAHWFYEGMGPSYKNIDLRFGDTKFTKTSLKTISVHQADVRFPLDVLAIGDVFRKSVVRD
jgi:hypothetical protein